MGFRWERHERVGQMKGRGRKDVLKALYGKIFFEAGSHSMALNGLELTL